MKHTHFFVHHSDQREGKIDGKCPLSLHDDIVFLEMPLTIMALINVCSMLNQGIAREGRIRESLTPDLPLQDLRGGARVQLRMVRRARLPVPDADVHLMAVLGLLQVRDGAAAGVRHEDITVGGVKRITA